jgi:hypothetical protein
MESPGAPGASDHAHPPNYSVKDGGSGIDTKNDDETALPGELISAGSQHLHRRLGGKEIQLLAVGGAIGTCMCSFDMFPLLIFGNVYNSNISIPNNQPFLSKWAPLFRRADLPDYS